MKSKLKTTIKNIIGKKTICHLRFSKLIYRKKYSKDNKIIGRIKAFKNTKIYYDKNKGEELKKLFKGIDVITISKDKKFYNNFDFLKVNCFTNSIIDNMCIDYSIILDNSFEDLKKSLNKNDEKFYLTELKTIEGFELLIDRIVEKNKSNKNIVNNLQNMKSKKADSLYEALQRILFINMLLWQTNHKLNGLGRLDLILIKYYKKDIENKTLNENEAKKLIKEFLETLHDFYEMKSSALIGDTGQIIELGGESINGEYLCNELTYLFIELMEELKLPDPKVLLRVSKKTPRSLIEKSLKCIQTGIGCPLFANDDVIIEKLINFGYEKEDAYKYGTSACWEPYIIGKASDPNNIRWLSFMNPLNDLLENEDLNSFTNIQDFIEKYKEYLKKYLDNLINQINNMRFEKDPILSLFIDDCVKSSKDISEGGAKYNNFGLTSVGLANLVNSICNIEEFVFKNKEMSFDEFNKIRKNNFESNEKLLKRLKNSEEKYGKDSDKILELANDLIKYTTDVLKEKRNYLGGRYKFGLSAPSYIDASKNVPASFDGRKEGEPFAVHISSDVSNGYTELVEFASKLSYEENRFNGNVVDFFVSPNFISDNFDKFVDFLMLSIKVGFFEMQMNVVSSKQLIEARKNPEKFPNLVVRVWGFSSYFKDLPDDYKDYLIERALKSEGNS